LKTTIVAILAAVLLASCANDTAYWQARQDAIARLPRSQQQEAYIELMREHHHEQLVQRQQTVDTVNSTVAPAVAGASAAIIARALCGF
jgi:ketosteroid isomerase-like protein